MAPARTDDAVNGASNGSAGEKIATQVSSAADSALSTVDQVAGRVVESSKNILDRIITPDQRQAVADKLHDFAQAHPKLAAFLAINAVLSGVPILLFIIFSITIFVTSIVVGLLVALLAAVTFTLFAVGFALLFLLPTIFFTTSTACFLFFWGFVGYYMLQWATGEKGVDGSALGGRLNQLTGGRLGGFIEDSRTQDTKKNIEEFGDRVAKTGKQVAEKEGGSFRD